MNKKIALATFKILKERLEQWAKIKEVSINIVLGGSVAKGTSIANDEIDVFIQHSFSDLLLVDTMLEYLINFSDYTNYSYNFTSHKYLTIKTGQIQIDVVPINSLVYDTMSASIAHVDYVNNHLSYTQKREVILLKKFLKKHNLYGHKNRGFSGYITELLIIKFNNFSQICNQINLVCKYLTTDLIDPVDFRRNLRSSFNNLLISKFFLTIKNFINIDYLKFLFKEKYKVYLFLHDFKLQRILTNLQKRLHALHIPFFLICESENLIVICKSETYSRFCYQEIDVLKVNDALYENRVIFVTQPVKSLHLVEYTPGKSLQKMNPTLVISNNKYVLKKLRSRINVFFKSKKASFCNFSNGLC